MAGAAFAYILRSSRALHMRIALYELYGGRSGPEGPPRNSQ